MHRTFVEAPIRGITVNMTIARFNNCHIQYYVIKLVYSELLCASLQHGVFGLYDIK